MSALPAARKFFWRTLTAEQSGLWGRGRRSRSRQLVVIKCTLKCSGGASRTKAGVGWKWKNAVIVGVKMKARVEIKASDEVLGVCSPHLETMRLSWKTMIRVYFISSLSLVLGNKTSGSFILHWTFLYGKQFAPLPFLNLNGINLSVPTISNLSVVLRGFLIFVNTSQTMFAGLNLSCKQNFVKQRSLFQRNSEAKT